MIKKAVFPGSFDPITIGHYSIVERALPLFDEIIIAIGENTNKKYMFSLEQRISHLKQAFGHLEKVSIMSYSGLTINFCRKIKASYILRGLRNPNDFEYEKSIAQMNKSMANDIETIFIVTEPKYSAISSTIVRDILIHGGNAEQFLPKGVKI
ncbi:MAG: pantetheine-phosphate adenylyltransferase [Bacteroidia bacterium]